VHIVHARGGGRRTTRPWHVGNHGIFASKRGVTARRSETSLSICPSRSQAERRRERAQRYRAGARQRSRYRPTRQHFEGPPRRIGPGDRVHDAAAAAAQGGPGGDQGTAFAAAWADGVLSILRDGEWLDA